MNQEKKVDENGETKTEANPNDSEVKAETTPTEGEKMNVEGENKEEKKDEPAGITFGEEEEVVRILSKKYFKRVSIFVFGSDLL